MNSEEIVQKTDDNMNVEQARKVDEVLVDSVQVKDVEFPEKNSSVLNESNNLNSESVNESQISTTLEQVPELNLENKESLVDDIIEKAKDLEHKMEEKFNEAMDKINKEKSDEASDLVESKEITDQDKLEVTASIANEIKDDEQVQSEMKNNVQEENIMENASHLVSDLMEKASNVAHQVQENIEHLKEELQQQISEPVEETAPVQEEAELVKETAPVQEEVKLVEERSSVQEQTAPVQEEIVETVAQEEPVKKEENIMGNASHLVGDLMEKASNVAHQVQENIEHLKEELQQQISEPVEKNVLLQEEPSMVEETIPVQVEIKTVEETAPIQEEIKEVEQSVAEEEPVKTEEQIMENASHLVSDLMEKASNVAHQVQENIEHLKEDLQQQISEPIKEEQKVVEQVQVEETLLVDVEPVNVEATEPVKEENIMTNAAELVGEIMEKSADVAHQAQENIQHLKEEIQQQVSEPVEEKIQELVQVEDQSSNVKSVQDEAKPVVTNVIENAQMLVGDLIEKASEIHHHTQDDISGLKDDFKPVSSEEQVEQSLAKDEVVEVVPAVEKVDASIEKYVTEPAETAVQIEENSDFNKEFQNLVLNSANKLQEEASNIAESVKNAVEEVNININTLQKDLETQIQDSLEKDEEVVLEVKSLPEAVPVTEAQEEKVSEEPNPVSKEDTKSTKQNSFFSSCSIL